MKDKTWAKRAWESALFHEVSGLAMRNSNRSRADLEKMALEKLQAQGITVENLALLSPQNFIDHRGHLPNIMPEIGLILDEERTRVYAEQAGFKDPRLFAALHIGEETINATIKQVVTKDMAKKIESIIKELSAQIEEHINEETRTWVNNLSSMTLFPDINLNDLKKQATLVSQHERLKQRAAKGEDVSVAFQDLSQQFKELHAHMGDQWFGMDLNIMLEKIEKGAGAVKLVAFNKATDCVGDSPTIKEAPLQKSRPNDTFDLGVEVTVPGIEKYLGGLQKRGSLNLCVSDDHQSDHQIDCKNGTHIKLTEAPTVRWQPPDYIIRLRNEIGSYGGINTEIKAQIKTCNGVPCLEMKNVNSKAQSAFLLLAGAGYTMENMIQQTVPAGESALPRDFGYAKLKQVRSDPLTGAVGMYYDLIHEKVESKTKPR